MAKTKLTFRINPFLVEQLAIEAEDDYRKNSEMLRLILEEAQSKLPWFIEQLNMKKDLLKRSKQRGEGLSVYLESEMVSQMRQQTIKTNFSMNQLVNEILRTRYGCNE